MSHSQSVRILILLSYPVGRNDEFRTKTKNCKCWLLVVKPFVNGITRQITDKRQNKQVLRRLDSTPNFSFRSDHQITFIPIPFCTQLQLLQTFLSGSTFTFRARPHFIYIIPAYKPTLFFLTPFSIFELIMLPISKVRKKVEGGDICYVICGSWERLPRPICALSVCNNNISAL